MKMNPYPAYKPTGLPWLTQIPEHWDCIPFRRLTRLKSLCGYVDKQLLSVYLYKGVVRFIDIKEKRTNTTSQDLSKYQLVEFGDFVLNNQQAWRGSVGVSMLSGIVSPAYFVAALSKKLHPHFANYLLRSPLMVANYCVSSKGIGSIQRNLDWQMLKPRLVPVPPPDEQQQIVRYLDSMTAKINKLIRAKKKQIALLQEQKANIISSAMKNDVDVNNKKIIPEGWTAMRLKHTSCQPFQYGANAVGIPFDENAIRYVRITDIDSHGCLRDRDKQSLPLELGKEYLLQDGDILFARCGGTVGKAYLYRSNDGVCCYAGYLIKYRPNKKVVLPEYIYLYTQSSVYARWLKKVFIQATIQNVNAEKYKNLEIIIPPLEEQRRILTFLEDQLLKIAQAMKNEERQIDCLIEYKDSLISSVATGQIDVRNISVDDFDPADLVAEPEDDAEEENSTEENEE